MLEEMPLDDSWKTAPTNWKWLSRADMDARAFSAIYGLNSLPVEW